VGFALSALCFVLVGCSDSGETLGPPDHPGPTPTTTSLEGAAFGPSAAGIPSRAETIPVSGASVETSSDGLSGEAPLAGVTVRVYELGAYIESPASASVLGSTTTDSEGSFSFSDLEPGFDLVVVVEGDPRLATLVPDFRDGDRGDVGSATTLAAEAWSAIASEGGAVPRGGFQTSVSEAEALLEGRTGEELLGLLQLLVPVRLGDGFPDDLPAEARVIADALGGWQLSQCEGLAPGAASSLPGRVVPIAGMPEGLGSEPLALVYAAQGTDRTLALVEWAGEDEGELTVPLHPLYPMEGGEVDLVFFSDEHEFTCAVVPFQIDPMTPSPGAVSALADRLEAVLVEFAEALGYSREGLLALDPGQAPPHVAGLAGALHGIGGSGVPNNLRAVLDGSAPILDEFPLDEEALATVEALVVASGLLSAAEGFATELQSSGAGQSPLDLPGVTPGSGVAGAPPVLAEAERLVETPSQLDMEMRWQGRCVGANQGTTATLLTAGGLTLAALAIFPPATAVAAPAAGIVTMMQIVIDICANGLPSELQAFEVEADALVFNEDSEEEGAWSASIVATSEGWTLTWPTTLGLIPGAGRLAALATRSATRASQVLQITEEFVDWMQATVTTAFGTFAESGLLTIPPQIVGPVVVDPLRPGEGEYFSWELIAFFPETETPPFRFTDDETGYVPQAAGISELRIRTRAPAFQGQDRVGQAFPEVRAVQIEILRGRGEDLTGPPPFYVRPDDNHQIDLRAVLDNVNDPSVSWSTEDGGFFELRGEFDEEATYFTPEAPGTYLVVAESLSRDGPRASNTPPRRATARIVVGGLQVTPPPGCIEVGDTFQFRAFIGGEEIPFGDLAWSHQGVGSMSSNGVYSASSIGPSFLEVWIPGEEDDGFEFEWTVLAECQTFTIAASGDAQISVGGQCGSVLPVSETSGGVFLGDRTGPVHLTLQIAASAIYQAEEEGAAEAVVLLGTVLEYQGARWTYLREDPGTGESWFDPVPLTAVPVVIEGNPTHVLSGSFSGYFTRFFDPNAPPENLGDLIQAQVQFSAIPRYPFGCNEAMPI
jgi:hypothetical protein